MGTAKELVKPYSNKGLQLKNDPGLLGDGYYQELTNLVSNVEGVLAVRRGALDLAQFNSTSFGAGVFAVIHSIARIIPVFISTPSNTAIYIGIADSILFSNSSLSAGMTFSSAATGCCTPTDSIADQRFSTAQYALGGLTWIFFACPLKMLKATGVVSSIPTIRWGIIPPVIPAVAQNTGAGTGPVAFTGAEVPYLYVYTYYIPSTGSESNPSQPMLTSLGITPNGNEIQVTLALSTDIPVGADSNIKVYRSGGSFADGLYRFLNFATSTVFFDTYQDQDIADNPIVDFDNDAPVTAGLPFEFFGTVLSFASGTGAAGAISTVNLATNTYGSTTFATIGTIFTIEPNTSNEETCCAFAATTSEVSFYFQNAHTAPFAVTAQAQTAAPCTITVSAFESMFLAGDRFNPHMLYKSKNNQPESWGVIEFSTGISDAIIISTPSDPIMALVEYSSTLIVMNLESIYYVSLFQGAMQTPVKSPAKRGLIAPKAYVKVSNEIWYLSYDGIYSFAGGEEQWRSEELDPLFHNITMGNYLPINLVPGQSTTGLDVITMIFTNNEVRMNYTDTSGAHNVLRYHTKLKRWSIDNYATPNGAALIFSLYAEADTGITFMGINQQTDSTAASRVQLWQGEIGLSDGWLSATTDGTAIAFAESQNTVDIAPGMDKLFSDFLLEATNSANSVSINAYYDWSTTVSSDVFTVAPAGAGRHRYPFSLQNSSGMLAHAMMLRVFGSSATGCLLYSFTIHYWELTQFTKGFAFDFSDEGYADDKVFRWLDLECDTGGVAATIIIQIDSETTAYTTTFTTTYQNRNVTISMPSNLIGRMVRFLLIPGSGGQTNYYKHKWNYSKEPPALTSWDSLEFSFGYDGYSFLKQFWLMYECPTSIVVTFYSDDDQQFYQVTLPAHPQREVERGYFPAYVGSVLNKSKTHRFTIISSGLNKLYKESSRLEWLACGSDQRGAYQQAPLTDIMQPQST